MNLRHKTNTNWDAYLQIRMRSAQNSVTARLLTLACAEEIDRLGAKGARDKIALIKVTVPELTSRVVDRAVQVRDFSSVFVSNVHIFCLRLNFFISFRSLVVLV